MWGLAILPGMKSFFFVGRVFLAWFFALVALFVIVGLVTGFRFVGPMLIGFALTLAWVTVTAVSHVHRVRLVSDEESFESRHRRQVELPFPPNEAFDLVDAAIRELPNVQRVDSARDSLQVHARMHATDPYTGSRKNTKESPDGESSLQNRVRATITPRDTTSSVTLICEPEGGAWNDWFIVDDGTNLENIEAITRAITRRVAERRRSEEATCAGDRHREGTHGRQAQPAARAGRAALPLQHARQRAAAHAQPTRPAPTRCWATSSCTCAIRCRAPRIRSRRWARNSSARAPTSRS